MSNATKRYRKIAVAIVKNEEGKVLVVRRKQKETDITGGVLEWTFPGGIIADSESFEEGAVRETQKTTGQKIYPKNVISSRNYHPFGNHLEYIECELLSENTECQPDNHIVAECKWVDPKELCGIFTTNLDDGVAEYLGLR